MRVDEYNGSFTPCTYILSSDDRDVDRLWEVAVYVKSLDELQSLLNLGADYDFVKSECGSGKQEIEAFGIATVINKHTELSLLVL